MSKPLIARLAAGAAVCPGLLGCLNAAAAEPVPYDPPVLRPQYQQYQQTMPAPVPLAVRKDFYQRFSDEVAQMSAKEKSDLTRDYELRQKQATQADEKRHYERLLDILRSQGGGVAR